jgi:transcriptional repressor NF-X1
VALNIDQSTHIDGGDHIPFSTETLNLFASHPKWGQTQEREFRVFAAAEDEKRLRFNPMQASQRAFIHALADDFSLDSESVDPEPHRHVLVWKTPRFVSAPNKTLADALRLRQQALRSANASDTESAPSAPKSQGPIKPTEPFNSFVIKNPRFALTLDEVRAEVAHVLSTTGPHPFVFDIEFLPSEEVVLKANTRTLTATELERLLQNLRAPLTRAIASRGYGSTQLCHADASLNITRLESDATGGDGWSRVAAKKVAPRTLASGSAFVGTNIFAALSGGGTAGVGSGAGKVTFAKKKPIKATKAPPTPVVVDDWEAAEAAEEEREKPSTANVDADPISATAVISESAPADQAGTLEAAVVDLESTSARDGTEALPSAALVTPQEAKVDGIESSTDAAAATSEDTPSISSQVGGDEEAKEANIDVNEEEDGDPSTSHGVRLDAP